MDAIRFGSIDVKSLTLKVYSHLPDFSPSFAPFKRAVLDAPLNGLKVCLHMMSFGPFNTPFNGPFFTVSLVLMKNGQNGFQPILSVFQPVIIDTMLNKKRSFLIKRAKICYV